MSMPLHQISAIPTQDATSARIYRSKTKEKEREEQFLWHNKFKTEFFGIIYDLLYLGEEKRKEEKHCRKRHSFPAHHPLFSENEKTLGHSMSHSSNISKAGGSSLASAPASAFSRASVTPSNQDICSASTVCSECCHQSPVQSAVVLKAPQCQSSLTQGLTVTVICKDTLSKRNSRGSERAPALKSADSTKARRTLKCSKSLNDVGEKAQDTVGSFDYVERTWSEGKLILPQDPGLRVNRFHQKEKRELHCKTLGSSKQSCVSFLSANYSTASEMEAGKGGTHIPLLEEKTDGETMSRSRRLLQCLFLLSRGSSASGPHGLPELESYATHLHTAESSSGLAGSTGFCSDEMGDDDVFEESTSAKWRSKVLRAPLCSVEKDSDLDCPSPPSEKCPPVSPVSTTGDACRICHCEGDEESPLITPCRCTGSLHFVHQTCLQQWIKSSDTRCCELCKYEFIMEIKLKPLRKWEKLQMTASERRKIMCSVTFHVIAITCVVWSLYVLIDRTTEEIKHGQATGILEWPFWTKLVVVAIGFTGGLLFMYVQCKVYIQLWKRLKAYNRVIYVQNCPETSKKSIFENSALTEPNFENKDGHGICHSDTNSSCWTEPEDTGTEIVHV